MCEIPPTLSSLAVKTRQGMPQDVHEEDKFILLASLNPKMDTQDCETQCEHQDYKTQRQIIFEADTGLGAGEILVFAGIQLNWPSTKWSCGTRGVWGVEFGSKLASSDGEITDELSNFGWNILRPIKFYSDFSRGHPNGSQVVWGIPTLYALSVCRWMWPNSLATYHICTKNIAV